MAGRTTHGPRNGPFGVHRHKIVAQAALLPEAQHRGSFAVQFLWPTVRELGFVKWSEMQYTTPAAMDLSEAAVSAMQRPCFDVSDLPRGRRFRTQCWFGWEVLRERHLG